MMETFELKIIAEKNGLEHIETTTASNGYPQSIQVAVIGFDTFNEAESFATENDLEVEFFEKRDGWNLWYRKGNLVYEEMKISSYDYGDDYSQLCKDQFLNEEDFIEEEVLERLDDFRSFDDIEIFLKEKKELWEKLEIMEDDEIVITCLGAYYETIKEKTMQFSHDTHTYVIGCI